MALRIVVFVAFVGMVSINALANILPINNISTGAVSDSYPNLFAPAGITFSIWGVIYSLLCVYSVYQFTHVQKSSLINRYYLATSIVNGLWIFSWHYRQIGISVVLMLVLLGLLIKIGLTLVKQPLTRAEFYLIRVPFSVYFGWITVATIANITTFLVSIGWNGWGVADSVWMFVVLCVGLLIGVSWIVKARDAAYAAVLVWAYFGIWLKHTSASGFNGQYPLVVTTVLVCIVLFICAAGFTLFRKRV